MKQMTKEQAKAFAENKLYEGMTQRQIAEFQLLQDYLCMPFEVFHKALEDTLGRPVYTHEMAIKSERLKEEMFDKRPKPTLEYIINCIPQEKQILVFA